MTCRLIRKQHLQPCQALYGLPILHIIRTYGFPCTICSHLVAANTSRTANPQSPRDWHNQYRTGIPAKRKFANSPRILNSPLIIAANQPSRFIQSIPHTTRTLRFHSNSIARQRLRPGCRNSHQKSSARRTEMKQR